MSFMSRISVAAAAVTFAAAPLAAQNVNLDPNYETIHLSAGFGGDPRLISLQSGGNINASSIGSPCRGYISNAPDVRLYYSSGSLPLMISAASDSDTTLIVNAPDGRWYCDDDSGEGLNPSVRFNRPMSGRYEIWVGTYGSASLRPAVLGISELYNDVSGFVGSGSGSSSNSGALPDINLDPNYGSVSLRAGFAPDPYRVNVLSGGSLNASAIGSPCRGYISRAPDFRLFYSSGSFPLIVSANSNSDTTLVVNAPDGRWYCDDDSGQGLNPSVRFNQPMSGRYEIWVGTYGSASTRPAELHISELYSQ